MIILKPGFHEPAWQAVPKIGQCDEGERPPAAGLAVYLRKNHHVDAILI